MTAKLTTYWRWVAGFAAIELMSWVLYHWHDGLAVGAIFFTVVAIVFAWRQPRWLAYLTVAEIIIGGKGYFFSIPLGSATLSIREIFFAILLIRYLPQVWQRWRSLQTHAGVRVWTVFFGWIVVMVLWGIARGNSIGNVFFDANAFAALAYVPLWWVSLTSDTDWREHVWSLLLAGSSWVAIKSLILVGLFGHNVSFLAPLYHWVRDTGIGEITWISSNTYRVFLQSQIYDLLLLVVLATAFVKKEFPTWWWTPFILAAIGTYISLSRSFWLGLGVAVGTATIMVLIQRSWQWWRFVVLLPLAFVAWLAASWSANFPRLLGQGQANALVARLTSAQSAEASTARLNQIGPLFRAIIHHPIIGSGFGTTVTYFSTDPRVHGWRTTSAFELGYLDLWLKIGLVGLALYGWWLLVTMKQLARRNQLALIVGTVALVTTHLTSPYLNHPLGLGWLAIVTLYAYV